MYAALGMILIICLQSVTALSFSMSAQGLEQAVLRFLSIYNDYRIDENIERDVVDDFLKFIRQNPDVFNYIATAQTDPEFLPYLEKYSNLKLKIMGRPIDPNVKVFFSRHTLKNNTDHDRIGTGAGISDDFTRVVFLDRGYWDHHKNNDKVREHVLFHELGHVDLYREHVFFYDDKHFYSFMGANPSLLILPIPVDLNRTWYRDEPIKFEEIRILRANLDSLFDIFYEELFSEEKTKSNKCDPISSTDCIITQREAFNRYKRSLRQLKQLTIGPIL